MASDVQITLPVLKVLRVMIDAPLRQQYGLQLMHGAGLKSGTLYPVLARLERAGWIDGEWEQEPHRGRPPRKFYKLSEDGMALARTALAEAATALSPMPVRKQRRAPRLGERFA